MASFTFYKSLLLDLWLVSFTLLIPVRISAFPPVLCWKKKKKESKIKSPQWGFLLSQALINSVISMSGVNEWFSNSLLWAIQWATFLVHFTVLKRTFAALIWNLCLGEKFINNYVVKYNHVLIGQNAVCEVGMWKSIYSLHIFSIHGYTTNSQSDQLPVGLIAQLVRALHDIAAVMGSNPVQALFFSCLSFSVAQVECIAAMIDLQWV